MTDPNAVAEAYIELWNDGDDASRRARLSEGWREDALYHDPVMHGESRDAIAEMISGARARFAGHSFVLTGTPEGHGDFLRFSWKLMPTDGPPAAAGTDVVRLDASGRIAEVIGFLDGGAA